MSANNLTASLRATIDAVEQLTRDNARLKREVGELRTALRRQADAQIIGALEVRCPLCGSERGEPCGRPSGEVSTRPHKDRLRAFVRARE